VANGSFTPYSSHVPTVLWDGPYRFFFSSSDGDEPPHIHAQEGKNVAKFWLTPVSVAKYGRFKDHEINKLTKIVERERKSFLKEWWRFFDVKR